MSKSGGSQTVQFGDYTTSESSPGHNKRRIGDIEGDSRGSGGGLRLNGGSQGSRGESRGRNGAAGGDGQPGGGGAGGGGSTNDDSRSVFQSTLRVNVQAINQPALLNENTSPCAIGPDRGQASNGALERQQVRRARSSSIRFRSRLRC